MQRRSISVVFYIIQILESLVGILTLAFVNPKWSFDFMFWVGKKGYRWYL